MPTLPTIPVKLKHDSFLIDFETQEFLDQVEYIRTALVMDRQEFISNLANDYIPIMASLSSVAHAK